MTGDASTIMFHVHRDDIARLTERVRNLYGPSATWSGTEHAVTTWLNEPVKAIEFLLSWIETEQHKARAADRRVDDLRWWRTAVTKLIVEMRSMDDLERLAKDIHENVRSEVDDASTAVIEIAPS